MPSSRQTGQWTGVLLVIGAFVGVARCLAQPDPPPDITPGEIILNAFDRSQEACVTRDEIMRVVTSNPMRWSENAPLDCTDAPPDTRWITIVVEDRTRFYAFGPDDCRIPVNPAPCQ